MAQYITKKELEKYLKAMMKLDVVMVPEEDRDNTTFCMWCMDDSDMWTQNEVEGNDGGKDFLLRYICKNPKEWINWAKDYYEVEIEQEVVQGWEPEFESPFVVAESFGEFIEKIIVGENEACPYC